MSVDVRDLLLRFFFINVLLTKKEEHKISKLWNTTTATTTHLNNGALESLSQKGRDHIDIIAEWRIILKLILKIHV
jgi:hypothetical protein